MKFKSKLAQAAYEEIIEVGESWKNNPHFEGYASLEVEFSARAIEVAAKIEIEEARNHAWSEPIQGTVEEKADCYHHDWHQSNADDIRDGKNTCSKCGLVRYDYNRGPK